MTTELYYMIYILISWFQYWFVTKSKRYFSFSFLFRLKLDFKIPILFGLKLIRKEDTHTHNASKNTSINVSYAIAHCIFTISFREILFIQVYLIILKIKYLVLEMIGWNKILICLYKKWNWVKVTEIDFKTCFLCCTYTCNCFSRTS